MAKIFLKGGTEHTLILAVREAYYQPFLATNWTDLRVGFFLSVCGSADPASDDVITGLGETIGTDPGPGLPWTDRMAIGLTDRATGHVFCGYTNLPGQRTISVGSSKLVSSDSGIGTSTTNFWRPKSGASSGDNHTLKIVDDGVQRSAGGDGSQLHLPQNTAGAGGYATLIAMRFRRDDPRTRAKVITMTAKTSIGHTGDILYTNTPTAELLESNLESFPTQVQQLGPVELSQAPDTIYAYWPWHNSRLRIHCYGLLRADSA